MPEAATAVRTRNVKTITSEDIEVNGGENKGLGVPWEEYLAGLTADELAIHDIYVYRKEPVATEGYLTKVHEAIDRQWLQDRFGGGVFDLTIRSKSGKSHYERNIKIAGEPKLIERERPPLAAAANGSSDPQLVELLRSVIEKLDQRANPPPVDTVARDSSIRLVAEGASEAIKLVAAQQQPAAKSGISEKLEEALLKRLIDPPAAPKEDPLIRELVQASIKRLTDPPTPPAQTKSLLDELAGLAKIRDVLGWGGGESGGGGKTTWLDLGREVIQHAPDIIEKWGTEISSRQATTEQERRVRAQVIAAAQANARRGGAPAAIPAASPTSANRPATRSAEPAAGEAESGLPMAAMDGGEPAGAARPEQPGGYDTESPEAVAFVKQRIVQMVAEGAAGGSIVAFLLGMRQEKLVEMLRRFPAEQITAFLAKGSCASACHRRCRMGAGARRGQGIHSQRGGGRGPRDRSRAAKSRQLKTPRRAYKRAGCVVRCGTVLLG